MVEHVPVMVKEVIQFLRPAPGQVFVDATLGSGGHAREILRLTSPSGVLIGIDWDEEAIEASRERLKDFGDRAILIRDNFIHLPDILKEHGIEGVDGLLFDLGVSALQLLSPDRGFSFQEEGPLDMRMDRRLIVTASEIVNRAPVRELERLIHKYGEERWARRIAEAIRERRERGEIETTVELAKTVTSAIPAPFRTGDIHPATRTFQAMRIAVNRELDNLEKGLGAAVGVLKKGGRLVVISFHSLEDGLVKRGLKAWERGCICPPTQPLCTCGRVPEMRLLTKKPLTPSKEEVRQNPKARSAKLRAAEKIR